MSASKREIKKKKRQATAYKRLLNDVEGDLGIEGGIALIRETHSHYAQWEARYLELMKWLKDNDKGYDQ